MAPELHTVEDMFALISDAIKNNAETITVEYDDELGYPTSVRIDQAAIMADEEISYSYSVELK